MRRALPLGGTPRRSCSLALTGCGAAARSPVPAAVKAPPQTARLGWVEPYPADEAGARLRGRLVHRDARPAGRPRSRSRTPRTSAGRWAETRYAAAAGIRCDALPERRPEGARAAATANGRPARRSGRRRATRRRSRRPRAGEDVERGRSRHPARSPAGLWVRISFGPFRSVGEPPDGAERRSSWFTDHAYELDEVAVGRARLTTEMTTSAGSEVGAIRLTRHLPARPAIPHEPEADASG